MEKQIITTPEKKLPLVAIVGPTNAGKSTLFNRLLGARTAVTAQESATTRDLVFGRVEWNDREFMIVDTAGLVENLEPFSELGLEQMRKIAKEADLVIFVLDSQLPIDDGLKSQINNFRSGPTLWLVANKLDSFEREKKFSDLNLGLPLFLISGKTGRRVGDLAQAIIEELDAPKKQAQPTKPIVAIIGRPNVGKSSLLNALTDKDRAIVSNIAGTTRDVVTEKYSSGNINLVLADTAGVRRRSKIESGAERFSLARMIEVTAKSTAVLLVIDGEEGSTRGDLHLLQIARDLKKPVLVVINKFDLVSSSKMSTLHPQLRKHQMVLVSATEKINLKAIDDWINQTLKESSQFNTQALS